MEDLEVMAPKANIFRHIATEAQRMKHEYSLRAQIRDLARVNEAYILARINRAPDKATFLDSNTPETACEMFLLDRLLKANVEDVSGGVAPLNLRPNSGFPAINYFLKETSSRPEVWLCGMALIPTNSKKRVLWLKNRFIVMVIAALMVLGPLLVATFNWYDDANPLKDGDLSEDLSMKELMCFGTPQELGITVLGFLNLILIFEITRSYAVGESEDADKMSSLPSDHGWVHLGQLCNMLCMVLTVIAMPLVFWTEMYPKDIIFDSLALLFIFQLDDFGGGALDYLGMDDADFQKRCVEFVACLSQCPVSLEDIFTMPMNYHEPMWRIRWGAGGLLRIGADARMGVDAYAVRRYMKRPSDSKGGEPEYDSCVHPGQPRRKLHTSHFRFMWLFLWYFLTFAEVVVPLTFVTINKPCYPHGQDAAAAETTSNSTLFPMVPTTTLAPVGAVPPAPAVSPETFLRANARRVPRREQLVPN